MAHHQSVEGGVRDLAEILSKERTGELKIIPEKIELAKTYYRKAGEVDPRTKPPRDMERFITLMDQVLALYGAARNVKILSQRRRRWWPWS